MIIEVTKEEIEAVLLRTINKERNIVDSLSINVYSVEDEQHLRVVVKKGTKSFTIHSLSVVKGDIWKRFILWSMADGFNFLNEYIIKQVE